MIIRLRDLKMGRLQAMHSSLHQLRLIALLCCALLTFLSAFAQAVELSNQPRPDHNLIKVSPSINPEGPGWLSPNDRRSGLSFKSDDLQAQQNDDAINPSFLWVDQGAKMWSEPPQPHAPSCASCHAEASSSMKGVALKYPLWHTATQQLVNLEWQINHCRVNKQGVKPLNYESDELLSLTSWVALQSRSMVSKRVIEPSISAAFLRGKNLYEKRIGQNNLSCANCHTDHYAQKLGGEIISQGQPHAYPAYRLEWQKMGSLQRRLRACLSGVKAVIFPFGSQELTELELYLQFRGQGLAMEAPGVRR
jgi:L-cysteine S-thiosulfotransferase